jgi:UDP-N-acetylglucosamine transferase subunit ALG13
LIFVSLGTQDFSFNRLLQEMDSLIEKKVINEEVFAQIGYSTYVPKHFHYEKFINFKQFDLLLDRCNVLITHGGTGTIIGALRRGKKIIAVPRLKKYNEHVDDHQTEIINLFSEKHLILGVNDVQEMEDTLNQIDLFVPETFVSGNEKIMGLIHDFIENKMK